MEALPKQDMVYCLGVGFDRKARTLTMTCEKDWMRTVSLQLYVL